MDGLVDYLNKYIILSHIMEESFQNIPITIVNGCIYNKYFKMLQHTSKTYSFL
jgi:hypothetical protein